MNGYSQLTDDSASNENYAFECSVMLKDQSYKKTSNRLRSDCVMLPLKMVNKNRSAADIDLYEFTEMLAHVGFSLFQSHFKSESLRTVLVTCAMCA